MINPWKAGSKVNPQREQGNRQLANEVYKQLIKADLSAVDYKLVLYVIDMTWGYNKPSTIIAISQIMEATELAERTIRKGIKSLKDRRILYYQPSKTVHSGAPLNEYLFNKHYDVWLVDKSVDNSSLKTVHSGAGCTVRVSKGAQSGQKTVHACAPLKRNDKENKESISKLYSNNIKSEYNVDQLIQTVLGKHAPRTQIVETLKRVGERNRYKVHKFLLIRYPGNGNKAYQDAVNELKHKEVTNV